MSYENVLSDKERKDREELKITEKTMGELEVGDIIVGPDGKPATVTAAYDEHMPKSMYEMEMEDGEILKVSGNHLWYCETRDDLKGKRKYMKLAKRYFKKNKIPNIDYGDEAAPIENLIAEFGGDAKENEFIKLMCESLGHSFETPHIEMDGYFEEVDEHLIPLYSYNDLLDFMRDLRCHFADESKGYFYFGKVRTTTEIFNTFGDVNIPTLEDIKK